MYQPETHFVSLSFMILTIMILTMLCWGSWPSGRPAAYPS
jgi:hypothetical protein